jgi:nucleotide-binding universal stress UspA family protein
MKNVLIAVDDTRSSKAAVFECTSNFCSRVNPETVTLLYVEKFEGRSLIDEMLGDAEMSTLKEVLEGTEYKQKLDEKANSVLDFHEKSLKDNGISGVRKVIRTGHPAEEILSAAKDEGADMIIVGSRGDRSGKIFMGSVSREVVNHADVPVLVVK